MTKKFGHMTRRLLVNDALNQLGERTFWNDLTEWFGMEFCGGHYDELATVAENRASDSPSPSLIVRNASYFGPIKASARVPTISLLQDIFAEGPQRKMQEAVCNSSAATVFNSRFTAAKYGAASEAPLIIPLPIDFSVFTPQNAMGCQQALGLPDGCVCWIGASQGAAGHVKGFDILMHIVRLNPDIPFVCVFKDAAPEYAPPNMRCFVRLPRADLVRVIGACRVGLCTSRTESQHLAGIEMGACGLPMVAPPVGAYWKRRDMFIVFDEHPTDNLAPVAYAGMLRGALRSLYPQDTVREYWRKEFDKPVIKAQWEKLIEEVECQSTT